MQTLLRVLLLTGCALSCVLGTNTGVGAAGFDETNMLLQWPGYLLLGLAGVLALLRWRIRLPHAPCELCLLAGCLVAAYVAARGLFSPVYKARMDTALVLASFVAFVLSASHLSLPSCRRAWFRLVEVLLLANLVAVLVHLSGDGKFFILPGYERPDVGRPGGLFISPNHLGVFANLTLFPLLGLCMLGGGKTGERVWLLLLSLVAIFCVAASASRGAAAALFMGLLVFVPSALVFATGPDVRRPRRNPAVLLAAAGGLSVFAGLLVSRFLAGRFGDAGIGGTIFGLFEQRKWYWWSACEQFRTAPLLGTGSRTFDSYFPEFRVLGVPWHIGEARFAHSEYFQMLGDYGLVGMLLLLCLLVFCMVHAAAYLRWCRVNRAPAARPATGNRNLAITLGALCSVIAVAVGAAFEFPLHVPAIALPTAVLLGMLANPGFEKSFYRPIRVAGVRVGIKLAVAASGLLLLYWGSRYLPAEYLLERARFAAAADRPELERIHFLNRARKFDPYNPLVFYHGGSARMEMLSQRMAPAVVHSIVEKASEDLARAVALDPREVHSRSRYAECLDRLGRFEEAGRISRGSLKLAPLHVNVLTVHGNHLYVQRRWHEAEAFYRSVWTVGTTKHDRQPASDTWQFIQQERRRSAEAKPVGGSG